ncbi:MAG: hypothetical protein CMI52_02985 [Parcubacteria group bacterium]|nr:hypothetical protein [Parcubacteria group bacterium]|tara:strand:+ start:460 stop:723 length:264 start_codon:yes stop_codon:yes gene_type:complete
MKLYELKRLNLTLGATRPRKMIVAAKTEEKARQLAHEYSQPFEDALDKSQVSCMMVAHSCSYSSERVITSFRSDSGMHALPPKEKDQ